MEQTKKKQQRSESSFWHFISTRFIAFVNKINNQSYLAVIRDAFALITPLLIAAALALLLNNVLFGNSTISLAYWLAYWTNSYKKINSIENIIIFSDIGSIILNAFKNINDVIYKATLGIVTLYITFLIGFLLAKRRKQESAILTGITTLAAFLVSSSGLNIDFFGVQGLFSGIIIAFLVAELYLFLQKNDRMSISRGANNAETIGKALVKLLPVIIILFILTIISEILIKLPIQLTIISHWDFLFQSEDIISRNAEGTIFVNNVIGSETQVNLIKKFEYLTYNSKWIYDLKLNSFIFNKGKFLDLVSLIFNFFTFPFMEYSKNPHIGLGLALIYVLFVQLFWFFGIPGTNVMNGLFAPLWLYATGQNINNFNNGEKIEYLFSQGFFEGFIFIGGWGMTLSLLITTIFVGRDRRGRKVTKLGVVPTLFNINQPVTFAYPLILNPILAIPAILGPVLLTIWTWFWMVTGVVPYAIFNFIFVAPVGIGGYITTNSWLGLVLALSNLILGILMYVPFILIANRMAQINGTAIKLQYLGKIHYWFTGKNFQDPRYKAIKKRQREENKIVKTIQSQEEKKSLKEKHNYEWIEYKNILKSELQKQRYDRKIKKKLMKRSNNNDNR